MDSVIDTQVLIRAENEECVQRKLLDEFKACKKMKVALDAHVEQEYTKKMTAQRFGKMWLAEMAKHARTVRRERKSLKRPVGIELRDKHHFDNDDVIFIRLALATETKRLTADDDDYGEPVRDLLKRKEGLIVQTTSDAIIFVKANH